MAHRSKTARARLLCGSALAGVTLWASAAAAQDAAINIPPQSLATALYTFADQSGHQVMFAPELAGAKTTGGVAGVADRDQALRQLLAGTGLTYQREADTFLIVRADAPQSGSAAGDGADSGTVEALIVTAQKREEDIQDVPIAISAFTQETLERSQVAGGPDLMTQVPNMTFTKTNFTSYSIQIRGIGTQAISATTDAAVAVAFNNTSFIRNRFFEQEFYDLQRVEVLRGPQGTLYGRNATAGVVNIISAKPAFDYEAKLSGDLANYGSTRIEGMLNLPLVDDVAALRLAAAWTRRDGFVTNALNGERIDGRDLWASRLSLRVEPTDSLRVNLVWEHFEEDDDRLRSGKQLCKKHIPGPIRGIPVADGSSDAGSDAATLSQSCIPASLYSDEAFQTPYGYALPYYGPLAQLGSPVYGNVDPYVSQAQSRDLRVIESTREAEYRAQSDVAQLAVELDLDAHLTLTSETAYSVDSLFSTQDFNRFNTKPGAFRPNGWPREGVLDDKGVYCDPQIGCSDRLVMVDLSTGESSQFSQEIRLSSDYDGPFNFSVGGNFLRYDTEDKYYVFINSLGLWAAGSPWGWGADDAPAYVPGVSDNTGCISQMKQGDFANVTSITGCIYIDPNPIGSLNDRGHNYFLSKNPYRLISYAAFGESYLELSPDLKVTAGLRWTVDKKKAPLIPSWLIAGGGGLDYPVLEVIDQEWREPTGRLAIDWKPALQFTDETLVYASYARGYKAGGANPPPAAIATYGNWPGLTDLLGQSKLFDPEYVNAFEVGAKNTILNGSATVNLGAFYYDYDGYQLSQIMNRSAVNSNFDAEVWGLEMEVDWRPLENLRLGLKAGYQNTRVKDGESAVDLMDRTAGNPDWVVIRPFPTIPSNCVMPVWFITFGDRIHIPNATAGNPGPCVIAYMLDYDPLTATTYVENPTVDVYGNPTPTGYPGFNPASAPNGGAGFSKELGGNELPNAPNYTATLTADYTLPLPDDWLGTFHTDIYYQSEGWTRIFNMEGYDKLKAYTNVNLAAIFTHEDAGWKVMAYVKNVFDRDSITGAFLNSDDTGLTTNVFLTEPRLYGLRVTKEWNGGGAWWDSARGDGPNLPFVLELGGGPARLEASGAHVAPPFVDEFTSSALPFPLAVQDRDLDVGDSREVKLTYRGHKWSASIGARFGRSNGSGQAFAEEATPGGFFTLPHYGIYLEGEDNYVRASATDRESHKLADFMVGRDVGLGSLAGHRLSVGLRYAELSSASDLELAGIPDHYKAPEMVFANPQTFHRYRSTVDVDRTFQGLGLAVAWDAEQALWRHQQLGELTLDGSLSGGVLFGRQKSSISETTEEYYSYRLNKYYVNDRTSTMVSPSPTRRRRSATIPFFGGTLGLSYDAQHLKATIGYRWERYFDAIDGGHMNGRSFDRTIDGPYFKLAIGFGG